MTFVAVHGHRGARGHAPENTLAGFETAVNLGVDSLEFDINVTSDSRIVIFHDQALNSSICRHAGGSWGSSSDQIVYKMSLQELKQFDVGRLDPASDYGRAFSQQKCFDGQTIPTLQELAELLLELGKDKLNLNIEVKSDPLHPDSSPSPPEFSDLLLRELDEIGWIDQTWIQSFDWRILQAIQSNISSVPTGYLTSSYVNLPPLSDNPDPSQWLAGFDPFLYQGDLVLAIKEAGGHYWGPEHSELSKISINKAHCLGMEVHTWTVNEHKTIKRLCRLGIDGITSDYPDRVREVLSTPNLIVPKPA